MTESLAAVLVIYYRKVMLDVWLEISTWEENRYFTDSNIVSEYDQEIPQSQTADDQVAPRGRAAKPPRDTRKTH